MTENQPEALPIDYPTGIDIKPKKFYPTIKSTITLFFVSILYMLAFGFVMGLVLVVLDNLHIKSDNLISFMNLLTYVVSLLVIIWYAMRKSKKSGYPATIDQ
jgi:ABC-type methionine transport system permease subunit